MAIFAYQVLLISILVLCTWEPLLVKTEATW